MANFVKCSVYGCPNTNRTHKVNKFPENDPRRCLKWLRLSGNPKLLNIPLNELYKKKVCRKHFSPAMFWNNTLTRLRKDAVPDILGSVTPLTSDQLLPVTGRLGLIPVVPAQGSTPPPSVQNNVAAEEPVTVHFEIETDSVHSSLGSVCIEVPPSSAPIDVVAEEPVTVHFETDSVQAENETTVDAGQDQKSPPKTSHRKTCLKQSITVQKNSQCKTLPRIIQKTSQQRISKLSILKEANVKKDDLSDVASRLLEVAHKYKCKLARSEKKLKEVRSRLEELEQPETHLNALSDKISPALYILLKGELLNSSRDPRGRDWTEESKCLNLAIKTCSPEAYAVLEKLFVVPCSRTLQKALSKIPTQTGINEVLDQLLQQENAMPPQDCSFQ